MLWELAYFYPVINVVYENETTTVYTVIDFPFFDFCYCAAENKGQYHWGGGIAR